MLFRFIMWGQKKIKGMANKFILKEYLIREGELY